MKKGKLLQACRKNQYKLTITHMIGDADGSKVAELYSNKFEGELEELYKIYSKQIKVAQRGLGLQGCEDLHSETGKLIAKNPILMNVIKKEFGITDEEFTEDSYGDITADYQCEFLQDFGSTDLGGHSPRGLQLSYFDSKGNEYEMSP